MSDAEPALTLERLLETIETCWAGWRKEIALLPPDGFDARTQSGWTVKETVLVTADNQRPLRPEGGDEIQQQCFEKLRLFTVILGVKLA